MKQIQKAIADRNEKEQKMRQALERAFPVYQKFREDVMRGRRVEFDKKMQEFINKKGDELKKELLEQAQRELKKIENIRKVQEAEQKRKEKDARIAAEKKAKGISEETLEEDGTLGIGWNRGVKVQPEVRDSGFPRGAGAAPREETGGLTRAGFGKAEVNKEEEKKEESKRPTFTKRKEEDGGFMSRAAMGT